MEGKLKRQRIRRHINVYIRTYVNTHTHMYIPTSACAYITMDPLEVAPVNEGTVDCLNGPHCFLPLGIGDVGSDTGTLVGVGVGQQWGPLASVNKLLTSTAIKTKLTVSCIDIHCDEV